MMLRAERTRPATTCFSDNHDAHLPDRYVELADHIAYGCTIAQLKARFVERAGCANGGDAVLNGEQHGSSYPGVELVACRLHLHQLQHTIPEPRQGRVISSVDDHLLELGVRRRQLVGLDVAAWRQLARRS